MRLLAVNYHYYRGSAPRSGIYPISPVDFSEQISELSKRWKIASETEVVDALAGDGVAALCFITFDDGLKEQMTAIRWLIERGLSAVCYVPTAPLTDRRVLDVHKLHIIRTLRSDAELAVDLERTFGAAFARTDRDVAATQYPYDEDDARQVKYFLNFVIDPQMRGEWVKDLFAEIAGEEASAAEKLYMDRDDVRELARHGMLGTHAHSHCPLATLDREGIRDEIGQSVDILADIAKVRVRGISYPYGGPTAANETVGDVAAKLGLTYGLSMRSGVNGPIELACPMLLSRIDTKDVPTYLTSSACCA